MTTPEEPHPEPRWEHFSHLADMGVRGVGPSREVAFEQAGLALIGVITNPQTVAPSEPIAISCEAPDDELLLVDWLNALVYEIATRKMLFGRLEVHIDGRRLAATAWGETISAGRHQPAVEVKGATYTALLVEESESGSWIAQCVVDV